jgi:hypothetical protein
MWGTELQTIATNTTIISCSGALSLYSNVHVILEKFIIDPAFAGNFEVLYNDHFVSIKLPTINTYPMKYICDGFMPYKKQQKKTNKKNNNKNPPKQQQQQQQQRILRILQHISKNAQRKPFYFISCHINTTQVQYANILYCENNIFQKLLQQS